MNVFDIIFFAFLAGFIAMRLFKVLGQNDTAEPDSKEIDAIILEDEEAKTLDHHLDFTEKELDSFVNKTSVSEVDKLITLITAQQPDFNLAFFMTGARKSFEMVLKAYAQGDKKTLRMLLDPEVYEEFVADLENQAASDQIQSKTLVAILESQIVEASTNQNQAIVKIKFVTEQINLTRDKSGVIIAGSPSKIEKIEDNWSFAHELNSDDPAWKIVKIS